jgi:hypothetical protein
VRISARRPLKQAARVNFLEQPIEDLHVRDGGVQLDVPPFTISTVRLRID